MNTALLKAKFDKVGARAKVRDLLPNRHRTPTVPVVIDIGHDRHGEFFDIQANAAADIEVLDVQPRDRHLLLMVRQPAPTARQSEIKDKFLCGHDERHWFVAGVPEAAAVSTVVTAKEALKPAVVKQLERGQKGKRSRRLRRKTATFVRQGEWFFLPAPDLVAEQGMILHHEPIRRGAGKPHWCEFLYRVGGETVYVCPRHPNGLTEVQYKKLVHRDPAAMRWNWRTMKRNPAVFVRGKVSHPDHATIRLPGWHRVEMNTEGQSRAMAAVAFLD